MVCHYQHEKLNVRALFHELWSNTPNSHIKTFAYQIEPQKAKCEDKLFIITYANKVDNFVAHMYLSNIFESKLLDDWEDGTDKSWASTKKYFVNQYNKEKRNIERARKLTPYNSSAVMRETPAASSGAPITSERAAYDAAIKWAQALEEQGTKDVSEILSLKSVGDANTFVSEYAASAVAAPPSRSTDLAALQTMVAQLAATIATF